MKKTNYLIIGIICFLLCCIITYFIGQGNISTVREVTPSTSIVTPTALVPATVFRLSDIVTVSDIEWHVIKFDELGNVLSDDNSLTEDLTTTGRFVSVTYEITNHSNEKVMFTGVDIVDDEGREFDHLGIRSLFFIDDAQRCAIIEEINPGITRVCTDLFEVPIDAASLKAKVTNLKVFGAKEELVELQ